MSQSQGGSLVIKKVAIKVNKTPTLNVRHWERRLPPGQSNKYTVLFEVRNSTKQQAKMRFVYGVFAKTDPERGHIIPVKQRDTRGNLHMFNTLTHGGAADYTIPANTPIDAPFVVSDLEIDLTKGVKPTDYVYVDVWAIDLTNHEHYPLGPHSGKAVRAPDLESTITTTGGRRRPPVVFTDGVERALAARQRPGDGRARASGRRPIRRTWKSRVSSLEEGAKGLGRFG